MTEAGAAAWWHWPGPLPWAGLVVLAALGALVLEAPRTDLSGRARAARATAVLAMAGAALWALFLAWAPGSGPGRALVTAAAWWLLALPVLALGATAALAQGPAATARLAATQAAPAIVLSFSSSAPVASLAAFSAGFLRAAAPPFHPLVLQAVEALPAGAVGLLVLIGLVLGVPVAAGSAFPAPASEALAIAVALLAGIAGMGAAAERDLLRRLGLWASVQAGLAIAISQVPAAVLGGPPAAAAAAHLGASAGALPLAFLVLGRLVVHARVSDLAAQAGLLAATPRRGLAVLAAVFLAVAASLHAPLTLAGVLALAPPGFLHLAMLFALGGWLGASLALLLAGYRIARGRASAPGGAPPEMGRGEALLVGLFAAVAAAAAVWPALWSGAAR